MYGIPAIIRANAFVLQDENGKARAELRMDKDKPGLFLYDENGKVKWQAP